MDNLTVGKDAVRVFLNPEIYPEDVLKKAAKDFASVADISLGKTIEIIPKDRADQGIIGYEFCNYLLGLMQHENKSL